MTEMNQQVIRFTQRRGKIPALKLQTQQEL